MPESIHKRSAWFAPEFCTTTNVHTAETQHILTLDVGETTSVLFLFSDRFCHCHLSEYHVYMDPASSSKRDAFGIPLTERKNEDDNILIESRTTIQLSALLTRTTPSKDDTVRGNGQHFGCFTVLSRPSFALAARGPTVRTAARSALETRRCASTATSERGSGLHA